jgi:hypothetical protein
MKSGAALVAVTALFVCLGAAPALGDQGWVLCKVNEACKKANFAGEAFTATSEAAFKLGELGTVKCSSTMSRNETELTGQIASLTFTGCSEGCEVKASQLPYSAFIFGSSGGNGFITISGHGGGGVPTLGILCGGIECVYATTLYEWEFKGGTPATIVVNSALTKQTKSLFCPKFPKWEAVYKITSPASAVYMTARALEGPVFCEVNEKVCPQAKITKSVKATERPGTVKITKLVGGVLTCSSVSMNTSWRTYEPGPYTYSESFQGCSHPSYTGCSASHIGNDYAYLFPTTGGNGEIVIKAGELGKDPTLLIKCTSAGTPFECKYSTEEIGLEFLGGVTPLIEEVGSMTKLEGSATFCPVSVVVQANYSLSSTRYMAEA